MESDFKAVKRGIPAFTESKHCGPKRGFYQVLVTMMMLVIQMMKRSIGFVEGVP